MDPLFAVALPTREPILSMPHPNVSVPPELRGALDRVRDALAGVELVPLDDERYLETHVIYEAHSDQRGRIVEWFGRNGPGPRADGAPFRVLSVGCGSGVLDVPVARGLAARVDELVYAGVNPNAVECDAFERAFREADVPGARCEVAREAFDDLETDATYDLVHFVHSLYYMPDPAASLERARELLAPGGRLVVFHAPREELNELATLFYDEHYGRSATLFAEDFAELFERRGWAHGRERVEAWLETTPLLRQGGEVGTALRDFIVQVDGRRLPPEVQELVESYLRLASVERDGRLFVSHAVDVFVLGE